MTNETLAVQHVRKIYASYRALYAPSVIAEAARLLDDLADTAARHGHDRSEALGGLARYAADATSSRYSRPQQERDLAELSELKQALTKALADLGLPLAVPIRSGVAVGPLPDRRGWGWDGQTGLAVGIYLDSNWDLTINQPHSEAVSIYALATPQGAREVAELVHAVMHGEIPDPFRDR
ncbi:hypothetical protein [Nonomuraea sp. NPDC050786]|uniref:hypothetical protein n=1 Tax=Nonomuraea sp. NPDC050786 TaxID=3154840 RepID=UPI0033CA2FD7